MKHPGKSERRLRPRGELVPSSRLTSIDAAGRKMLNGAGEKKTGGAPGTQLCQKLSAPHPTVLSQRPRSLANAEAIFCLLLEVLPGGGGGGREKKS